MEMEVEVERKRKSKWVVGGWESTSSERALNHSECPSTSFYLETYVAFCKYVKESFSYFCFSARRLDSNYQLSWRILLLSFLLLLRLLKILLHKLTGRSPCQEMQINLKYYSFSLCFCYSSEQAQIKI